MTAAWPRMQWAMVMLLLLAGCGGGAEAPGEAAAPVVETPATASPATDAGAMAAEHAVLVLGDSLSAGYGMAASQGWVALAARKLEAVARSWS